MSRSIALSLCVLLVVFAIIASVDAAPREKRQILGAILEGLVGHGHHHEHHHHDHHSKGYGDYDGYGGYDRRYGRNYGGHHHHHHSHEVY
uniref:Uncharacterized protein n=1 Tax=Daphnia galeata TaxID=27404 RepID=A0A8J2WK67_9CRUS|nr:unnamed protein product [Daphnia galeata]